MISMAVDALVDLVPVSPDELEIILKALNDEGVEEAVDVRLAYGGDDGKKAAEVFAKYVSIPSAFDLLRFTAENVSEADMKVLDMQAKPAEPRRRRYVQDGRLLTDYSDLVAAKFKAAPKRIRTEVPNPSPKELANDMLTGRIDRCIRAAEAAAKLSTDRCPVPIFEQAAKGAAVSIAETDDRRTRRALAAAYQVLRSLGRVSPRWVELYDSTHDGVPPATLVKVQDEIFMARTTSHTVLKHCSELNRFLEWLQTMKVSTANPGALLVSSYILSTRARGKSIPNKVRTALVWSEETMGAKWSATEMEVKRLGWSMTRKGQKDAKAAAMLPVVHVMALERLVFDAPSYVLRYCAGVMCLMVHGLKRWADVLFTKAGGIELTTDAVIVACYRSKRKANTMLCGALRKGFTDLDWGGHWYKMYEQMPLSLSSGAPRDFLMSRPAVDFTKFRETAADHADATRAMHALLTLSGLDPVQAAAFTTHSCRHVLPTLARQLRMPKPERDGMGRWGESMADYYDSIDCVAEIASKEWIRANVAAGWRPVGRGRLPMKPRVTRETVCLEELDPVEPEKAEIDKVDEELTVGDGLLKGGAEQLAWCRQWKLPDSFLHVLNVKRNIVHLYTTKDGKTACGVMKCKTPERPARNAVFAKSWDVWDAASSSKEFCTRCYGMEASVFSKHGVLISLGSSSSTGEAGAGSTGKDTSLACA